MKKILIVLLLISVLACLCACGEKQEDTYQSPVTTQNPTEPQPESPVTAQEYYQYLNTTVLGGSNATQKLANVQALNVSRGRTDSADIAAAGGTGLLSALVQDVEGDGCLEMLVVTAEHLHIADSAWRPSLYALGQTYTRDEKDAALVIRAYLYDYKDDSIYLRTQRDINLLPNGYLGNIYVGIEKIEDACYIFSGGKGVDADGKEISPRTLTQVDGGKMVFVYSSKLRMGYITPANTDEKLGIHDPIDMNYTSLKNLKLTQENTATAGDTQALLGERALCYVQLSQGQDALTYTATDFTGLREYLADDAASWQLTQLPAGEFYEKPQPIEDAVTQAEELGKAAGVEFVECDVAEENGKYLYICDTEAGSCLTLVYDNQTKLLQSMNLSFYQAKPKQEWYDLKDAILARPEFDLTKKQTAPFRGSSVDWNKYTKGIQVGECEIALGAANSAFFRVTFL